METRSLKALSIQLLERNQRGNSKETKSFLRGENGGQKLPKASMKQNSASLQAQGYGCGQCGNKVYRQVTMWKTTPLPHGNEWEWEHRPTTGWQCEKCGAVYSIIVGSRGPILIQ